MKLLIVLTFLLLILIVHSKSSLIPNNNNNNQWNSNEMANVLNDLIKEIQNSLRVTAMICWNPEYSFNIMKTFYAINGRNSIAFTPINLKYFPNSMDEHHELILLDINCLNTTLLLDQIDNKMSINYKWIIMNRYEMNTIKMDEQIQELFQNRSVLLSSEVYYLSKSDRNDTIIKTVYRTSLNEPLKLEIYGQIYDDRLYYFGTYLSNTRRRQNLHGTLINASLVITNNDTFNHLSDYRHKEIDTITKVSYLLTNLMIEYVNATVNYSIVNTWGYQDKLTNDWSGMIGDLVHKKCDIGASALFFTIDRISIIEYIGMPSATRSKFIFRSPKLSYTDNVFFLPFNDFVWICLIALILITAIFLSIATFIEWKMPSLINDDINDSGRLRPSTGDVFLVVFGAICQQGSAVTPKSSTARIIMIITFIILMFLYTSYAANIVALLQSPSTKIKTLQDLLNSRLKFGADDTVFNRYYFSHENETIRKNIYEQKIIQKDGSTNFMALEEGVKRLRDGLFAFHMELGVGYKLIGETFYEDEKCGLQEIQYLQVIDPWYAIQKNSTYKELFKIGLMRLHEHGLQDRINAKLYTRKPKCIGGGGNFITASLIDTKPAILILLWGFLFSTIILSIELITNHTYKTNYIQHKLFNYWIRNQK